MFYTIFQVDHNQLKDNQHFKSCKPIIILQYITIYYTYQHMPCIVARAECPHV